MSVLPTADTIVPKLLWRPDLAESADGRPLATHPSDLLPWNFPYDRLPSDDPWVAAVWLRPDFCAVAILYYVTISRPVTAAVRDKILGLRPRPRRDDDGSSSTTNNNKASQALTNFIALHNLALAIFSAVTAWNSWGLVVQHYLRFGWWASYCDPDGHLWSTGLGAWCFIFYISKYYEFVDTWCVWKY